MGESLLYLSLYLIAIPHNREEHHKRQVKSGNPCPFFADTPAAAPSKPPSRATSKPPVASKPPSKSKPKSLARSQSRGRTAPPTESEDVGESDDELVELAAKTPKTRAKSKSKQEPEPEPEPPATFRRSTRVVSSSVRGSEDEGTVPAPAGVGRKKKKEAEIISAAKKERSRPVARNPTDEENVEEAIPKKKPNVQKASGSGRSKSIARAVEAVESIEEEEEEEVPAPTKPKPKAKAKGSGRSKSIARVVEAVDSIAEEEEKEEEIPAPTKSKPKAKAKGKKAAPSGDYDTDSTAATNVAQKAPRTTRGKTAQSQSQDSDTFIPTKDDEDEDATITRKPIAGSKGKTPAKGRATSTKTPKTITRSRSKKNLDQDEDEDEAGSPSPSVIPRSRSRAKVVESIESEEVEIPVVERKVSKSTRKVKGKLIPETEESEEVVEIPPTERTVSKSTRKVKGKLVLEEDEEETISVPVQRTLSKSKARKPLPSSSSSSPPMISQAKSIAIASQEEGRYASDSDIGTNKTKKGTKVNIVEISTDDEAEERGNEAKDRKPIDPPPTHKDPTPVPEPAPEPQVIPQTPPQAKPKPRPAKKTKKKKVVVEIVKPPPSEDDDVEMAEVEKNVMHDAYTSRPSTPPRSFSAAPKSKHGDKSTRIDPVSPVERTNIPSPPFTPPLSLSPLQNLDTLTEAEMAMTVGDWIRYQTKLGYEKFKEDGERELRTFEERAEEVRRAISKM